MDLKEDYWKKLLKDASLFEDDYRTEMKNRMVPF